MLQNVYKKAVRLGQRRRINRQDGKSFQVFDFNLLLDLSTNTPVLISKASSNVTSRN